MSRRAKLSPREHAALMVRIYRRQQDRIAQASAAGLSIPPMAVQTLRAAKSALYDVERKYPRGDYLPAGAVHDGG